MVLDRVHTTYQTQLLDYGVQAHTTTALIKKLKENKKAAKDKSKLGVNRIRVIVPAWKERTKRMIDESLVE